MSPHLKGILITTLGVIILSPDALLIRLLNTDTWTVIFWRGFAFSIGITLLIMLMYRGKTVQQFKNIGKPGLLIGIIFAVSSLCFTVSVQNTSIANTLVIISTSPAFAALFSWWLLGERVNRRTVIAMIIVMIAIVAIMSQSVSQSVMHGIYTNGFLGDLSAVGTAVSMAISFTLTRKFKETNMVPAMALSGLITMLVAGLISVSMATSLMLEPAAIPIIILTGVILTAAYGLITLGPRYISAPEVSLIMPLEIVFGSYLGWVFLNEKLSMLTLIGGFVIILTLSINAKLSLIDEQKIKQ